MKVKILSDVGPKWEQNRKSGAAAELETLEIWIMTPLKLQVDANVEIEVGSYQTW